MLEQKIGRYQLVRLIGKGGMGQVYEAVDPEIERRAAIKILHPQFTEDSEMAARFLNEARAVNIIQHPSLVSAFEFGRLPSGSAYIIMEYLDGETLRERLKRCGALGLDAIRLARQITSALVAAHAKHIVHRDLKPSNIMIVADPDMVGGERVKVVDFGIAKLAANSVPGQVETRTGAMLGSPGYMSPEQCKNVSTVDERSDVYSLGAVLYEMLCGRAPFLAASDAEMFAAHLFEKPAPLQTINPAIPTELAAFVDRMLAKQATDRPSSTEVLAYLNQQAGFPAGASMPHQIVKAPRRATGDIERSTLSQASGQGTGGRLPRRLRWAGGLAAVTLGLGGVVLSGSLLRSGTKPAVAPGTRKVLWTISSTPTGAEVLSSPDKQVLGRTPLRHEQLAADGRQSLTLRHPGYVELPVTLDRSANSELALTLSPLPAVALPTPTEPVKTDKPQVRSKSGSTGKSDKRRRTGKTTNADIDFIK